MATHFPGGLTSYGIPVLSGAALPFNGLYLFVDPVNGLDGNEGSVELPMKTLSAAHAKMRAGRNDVCFLIGNGALSGSARESATLAWSKDACHLIGIAAPTEVSQRARIAATTGVNFTPLVNVTGAGCLFMNLHAFHGYNSDVAQVCWDDNGQRNAYVNCHFAGMGHATAAGHVGGRSLRVGVSGQGENTFERCVIGLDTIARSVANMELEIHGGSPRNVFRRCLFPTFASSDAHLFAGVPDLGGMDRWALFDECAFINAVKSTAVAMLGALKMHASAGGLLLLQRCSIVGAADVEEEASNNVFIDGGPPTATTTALAVNNA